VKHLLPLVADTISALEGDGLLASYMGTGAVARVVTERPASDEELPFLVLDVTQATAYNTQSFRGTEYEVQISAYFARTEQGTSRGILDVARVMERVRDVLDDRDQYALAAGPSDGESVVLDFDAGRYETSGQVGWIVLRQYTNAVPPSPTGDGLYIMAASRFRVLVSDAT
jgi:hypothetical protein